jgi:hypothetical protein
VLALLGALLSTVLAIPLAHGHHAFRVVYDFSQTRTIEGRVVRLELVNPHARLFLAVANEDGNEEEWMIEGPGKLALARRGWTDDMFADGEIITAVGNPASAGDNAIWLESIARSDGSVIIDPLVSDELAIEEERRQRIRRSAE